MKSSKSLKKEEQEETKETPYPLQKLQTSRQCEDGGGGMFQVENVG